MTAGSSTSAPVSSWWALACIIEHRLYKDKEDNSDLCVQYKRLILIYHIYENEHLNSLVYSFVL